MGGDALTDGPPRPKARLGRWRSIPLSIRAFSLVHVLLGLLFLLTLIGSRCVDEPPPPGTYPLDGCTAHSDPWRDGSAPYFMAIIIAFIVSAIGLLRPIHLARVIFLVAIASVLAIPFCMTVVAVKEHMDLMNTEPRNWGAAWNQASGYMSFQLHYLFWLLTGAWLIFDAWLLCASRARIYFRAPPAPDT